MYIKLFSNRSTHGWVLLAAIMALFTGACKKTNSSGGSEQTLQQYFKGSTRYTLFNHALEKTHLNALLGGTDSYTVFAVDDSAMTSAGFTTAGIDSADIGVLTGILRYHLVPGAIDTMDVQLYQETILTTADSSYQAYLEYNNFGLFYNGIPLVSVGNKLVNGIVHGVKTMARPPVGDIVTTIARTPGLSDFNYVVTKGVNIINVTFYYNTVIPFISGTSASPITLILPDDNFYASLGLDSYSAILQQQGPGAPTYMTQGQLFTSDFAGENIVSEYSGTLKSGSQLWFSRDGYSFVENNTTNLSNRYRIVRANIVATNGIIHVIEPY